MLRRSVFAILAILATAATQVPGTVEIKRVFPVYKTTRDFKRISEYFTDKEETGNRIIVRSDAEHREGTYFILHLGDELQKVPSGAKARLEIIIPEQVKPVVQDFALPDDREGKSEIFLGMTHEPFRYPEQQITAWRVTLNDKEGNELAMRKSFLWGD